MYEGGDCLFNYLLHHMSGCLEARNQVTEKKEEADLVNFGPRAATPRGYLRKNLGKWFVSP